MRYCIVTVMAILMSMVGTIGFAAIPRSELALGGVTLFTRFANVRQIYGEPTRTSYNDMYIWGGTVRFYAQYYGNGSFWAMATNRDGVLSVTTTANNGIGTPAGIKVGMSVGRLSMVYGEADYIDEDKNGDSVFHYNERKTGVGCRDSLDFTVRDGRIIEISLVAGVLYI